MLTPLVFRCQPSFFTKEKTGGGNHPCVRRSAWRHARDGGHPDHRRQTRKLGHGWQALAGTDVLSPL